MKIRAKLTLLILGNLALLAIAASLYFILLFPVDRMEKEKSYFTDLSSAMRLQQVALNRLSYLPIVKAYASFTDATVALDASFKNLDNVKVLPTANADLKNDIDVIKGLKDVAHDSVAKIDDDSRTLIASMKSLFAFLDMINLYEPYARTFNSQAQKSEAEAVKALIKPFMSDILGMDVSIDMFEDTISQQFAKIDHEIAAVRSRAFGTAGIIVVIIVGITLLGSILIARGIAKSIIRIERNIVLLKEGDLSKRSKLSTKDEIGSLSGNLNLFLDGLSNSILNIKDISKANIDSKGKLIIAASEATSSATQIGANAKSIEKQVRNLDGRIAESAGSIGKIAVGITDLKSQIEGQGAMVEEATASVTEMLSSLTNMSRITEKNQKAAEDLVAVSERGRTVFETVSAKIGEIPQNIGVIRDMASVIQNIASQTNLLAMNAAIEAAHAGESGRGFAVVADEIRKLSEASTTSSRDIAESIKGIVSKIEEASTANAGTNGAFAAIEERIKGVSTSMTEIHASINEIQVGSRQILDAMVDLQDRSLGVRAGSKSMEEGSTEITEMMADVGRISSEVANNITEIAHGIEDIGSSIRSVGSLSEDVGSGSALLDAEVSRFKTAVG